MKYRRFPGILSTPPITFPIDPSGEMSSADPHTSSARSYTMSLTAGSYYFTVAAANLLGRGVESVPSNVVTAQ